MKKWTPRDVIDAMRDVDPYAEQTRRMAAGLEETPGVPAPAIQYVGEEQRFTGKWANESHNALGHFLHAPTLHQIESGTAPSVETMVRKATAVADRLTAILESTIFRLNIGQFYELKCADCGATIKRRFGSFSQEEEIVCRTATCRATYDVIAESGGEARLRMRLSRYTCPQCRATNDIGTHRVKPGETIECPGCHGRFTVALTLVPKQEPGTGGSSDPAASY